MSDEAVVAAIAAAIRRLGAEFDPGVLAATRGIYAPFFASQPRDATRVRADVAYGPHERNALDIYGVDLDATTVLFFHGGGFTAGNKRGDDLFYANIGHAFAGAGVRAILANYRLAPAATWPSGIEDVERAVEWVRANLGAGRDGRPLVVVGNSAGATHVAGYLFDPSTTAHAQANLAGAILMSGTYRMSSFRSPGALAYFGDAHDVDERRSPIGQVRAMTLPILVTVAELDPARIAWHSFELAHALTKANQRSPAFAWFRDHNHVSTVHSLGSPQREVGDALVDFVHRCAEAR